MENNMIVALLNINDFDRRKDAETIEGTQCNHDKIKELLDRKAILMDISTFMDSCNDQEIDLEQYWVSYVYFNNNL
jgi:hypothetical protein